MSIVTIPLEIDDVILNLLIKRKGQWVEDIAYVPSGAISGTKLRFKAGKKMIVVSARLVMAPPNSGEMLITVNPNDLIVDRGDTFELDLRATMVFA